MFDNCDYIYNSLAYIPSGSGGFVGFGACNVIVNSTAIIEATNNTLTTGYSSCNFLTGCQSNITNPNATGNSYGYSLLTYK